MPARLNSFPRRSIWAIGLLCLAASAAAIYAWSPRCTARPQPSEVRDAFGRQWRLSDLRPETRLEGADLRRAQWRCVRLTGVKLSRCDLRGADLRGADLRDVVLLDTNLEGAMLDGA